MAKSPTTCNNFAGSSDNHLFALATFIRSTEDDIAALKHEGLRIVFPFIRSTLGNKQVTYQVFLTYVSNIVIIIRFEKCVFRVSEPL